MDYKEFFGLKDTPFRLTPDPDYYFPSGVHREALQTLLYSIRAQEGFIQITGEPGTGKTLTLRTLLRQLGDEVTTALILNPRLSPEELLKVILEDLGINPDEMKQRSKEELLRFFRDMLLDKARKGLTTVLIVDEAQNLPNETLEELRLLSNLETEKKKLLQIILVGQLELEHKLKQDDLKQLDQRITIRYRLKPLSREDTVAYINHRLAVAGGEKSARFSPRVLAQVYKASHGIPRLINIISERALMAAFVDGQTTVERHHLNKALESIAGEKARRSKTSAEARARVKAEQKAKAEGEAEALAEIKAQVKEEIRARAEAEARAKAETEARARAAREAEDKVRAEAEARERTAREAEDRVRAEAEARARAEAEAEALKEIKERIKEQTIAEVKAEIKEKALTEIQPEPVAATRRSPLVKAAPVALSVLLLLALIGVGYQFLTNRQAPPPAQAPAVSGQIAARSDQAVSGAAGSIKSEQTINRVKGKRQAGPPEEVFHLPPDKYLLSVDKDRQSASLWKGDPKAPVLVEQYQWELSSPNGLFILGESGNHGQFFINYPRFFWYDTRLPSPAIWREIAKIVPDNVIPVIAYSSREGLTPEYIDRAREIRDIIQKWADAWRRKDLDAMMKYYGNVYTTYYDQNQNPMVYSKEQLYQLKKSVFVRSGPIELTISDQTCLLDPGNPDMVMAFFNQKYRSQIFADEGTKALCFTLVEDKDGQATWKIVAKLWVDSLAESAGGTAVKTRAEEF